MTTQSRTTTATLFLFALTACNTLTPAPDAADTSTDRTEAGRDAEPDVDAPVIDVSLVDVSDTVTVDGGCLPNTYDLDGNPSNGCEYMCTPTSMTADPLDPGFVDANCDGSDGVVADCVFVSPSRGNDTRDGTRQEPRATVAAGIARAVQLGRSAVCLAGEVFNETVNMQSGVSVFGGFDAANTTFLFRRTASATTTVRATGTAFLADVIGVETHIEGINIDVGSMASAGSSACGVRLNGGSGQLVVRYNTFTLGDARPGATGASGTALSPMGVSGVTGSVGCSFCSSTGAGGPAPTCSRPGGAGGAGGNNTASGRMGLPGSGGAMGGLGGPSTMCFGSRMTGGTGAVGSSGTSSASGTGGTSLGTFTTAGYVPANGGNGVVGVAGHGGGGGGGGGGGQAGTACNADGGGGGGSGGCGGDGGPPGLGGSGGGGSFGVLVLSGLVSVQSNTFTMGSGAAGGVGGNGVLGQLGGSPGTGGTGADDSGGGGRGGNGGNGGNGGSGGGGGGGPSACLARRIGVTFTFSMNTCTLGTPGLGGAGGSLNGVLGAPGSVGVAMDNLQFN